MDMLDSFVEMVGQEIIRSLLLPASPRTR